MGTAREARGLGEVMERGVPRRHSAHSARGPPFPQAQGHGQSSRSRAVSHVKVNCERFLPLPLTYSGQLYK